MPGLMRESGVYGFKSRTFCLFLKGVLALV
jgi:hypothetical protein